jgi:hypothetical protein
MLLHCHQVIVQYILDKWGNIGPSLLAATPEARATAALAARLHDQYITPIQARAVPAALGKRLFDYHMLQRKTHHCRGRTDWELI